jgi:hypothetical protein
MQRQSRKIFLKKLLIYFGGKDSVGYSFVYVKTLVIFERYLEPDPANYRKRANNLATHLSRSWQIHFSHLTFKTYTVSCLYLVNMENIPGSWSLFFSPFVWIKYQMRQQHFPPRSRLMKLWAVVKVVGKETGAAPTMKITQGLWRFLKESPMRTRGAAFLVIFNGVDDEAGEILHQKIIAFKVTRARTTWMLIILVLV